MSALAERLRRIDSVGYDYAAVEKETVRACNLCGSGASVELSDRDRYGFAATCRLCERCGLGYLSPRPTRAEYAAFYEATYRPLVSAYHGRTIDATTVQEDQRGYAAELAAFVEPSLPGPPGSIIDVGGSTGVVGGALGERFGCPVTVLDPAPEELAVAEESGMQAIHGFAEEYRPEGRTWDLVLLCQTIDHLLDVAGALRSIAAMIAPDGRAFVDVLDLIWVAERAGSVEGAVKVDHPHYLTRETARAYFALAGLAVEEERLSGDGHWGFVLSRGSVREPDWPALEEARDRILERAGRHEEAAGR